MPRKKLFVRAPVMRVDKSAELRWERGHLSRRGVLLRDFSASAGVSPGGVSPSIRLHRGSPDART